ncbi:MAG TPA: type II secretion system protein [Tepidisphaeraceae bacterium]|nr:type II secretion system protein [Tepidisphaeraceae bacterium]
MRCARRGGFSLVELLVCLGIVAVLLAILLPVLAHVRKSARATVCLAHLEQWSHAYQMYFDEYKGHTLPRREPTMLHWWEQLAPYNSDVRGTLICPEAYEPRPGPNDPGGQNKKKGSASHAWWLGTKSGTEWVGSYGLNWWVYANSPESLPFIRFPAREAERVPLVGDCCEMEPDPPRNGEPLPENLQQPVPLKFSGGVAECCVDRHRMAVNFVFLDGHAERMPLAELWKLRWSEDFEPRDVVLPKE